MKHSKFIQITSNDHRLYALDDRGRVWRLCLTRGMWILLVNKRNQPSKR